MSDDIALSMMHTLVADAPEIAVLVVLLVRQIKIETRVAGIEGWIKGHPAEH